jgi:hypothetical protein
MNSKQRRTLAAVFADPVSPTIKWRAIESMLVALGCELIEGKGVARPGDAGRRGREPLSAASEG